MRRVVSAYGEQDRMGGPSGPDIVGRLPGIVPIVTKRDYSFNLAAGTQDIVLAKYVDTTGVVSGALEILVHARSFGVASTLNVQVHNVSYCEEEPNTYFVDTSRVVANFGLTNVLPTNLPGSATVVLAQPVGSAVRVLLDYATAGAGLVTITLSINLIGREN